MAKNSPKLAVLYAESYQAVYNTLTPEERRAMDQAKQNESFFPRTVQNICRRMAEQAEEIYEKNKI